MRILVLSREYPSSEYPTKGIWAESLTRHYPDDVDTVVMAPVPYCPPLPGRFHSYTRHRRIERVENRFNVPVHHPRFLLSPGYTFRSLDAHLYYLGVVDRIDRLHASKPFDLIHAHFGYPDGVVAARIGDRLNIPVIVTDHAFWQPWMNDSPRIRRQTLKAAQNWAHHVCVSRAHEKDILALTNKPSKTSVIPLGYDPGVFFPDPTPVAGDDVSILFVGFINYTKGVDTLFRAMKLVLRTVPRLKLIMIGGGFDSTKLRQEDELKQLASDLDLGDSVVFEGIQPPAVVADHMRKSTMLVSASRRETFGTVLVEALACGIPVVATRSGGPEDILTNDTGVFVPVDDAEALATGIRDLLTRRSEFDRNAIHNYARTHFSWDRIVDSYLNLYLRVLGVEKETL